MLKVKEWKTNKPYELNKWYTAGYSNMNTVYFLYLRSITLGRCPFSGEYFLSDNKYFKKGSIGAFENIFREASDAEIKYYNLLNIF